ncbi:hypothetical protein [Streptomyces globisporus]|uniref:hypothetical protein n=1 Tax=Streptomyces globisporus TaxID=1908 RepID=UPI000A8E0D77|nr:hypothetical protein [Streptomyces globisporus]
MEIDSGDPAAQQQDYCPPYAPPESGRELGAFVLEFAMAPDEAARKHLVETSGETLAYYNELHGCGLELDISGGDNDGG